MNQIDVLYQGRPLGRIVRTERGTSFAYHPDYPGVSISPFLLPRQTEPRVFETPEFGGLPGVFADSLPDQWGERIMQRYVGKTGRDFRQMTAFDKLSFVGPDAIGALSYEPAWETAVEEEAASILQMEEQARLVAEGTASEVLPTLLRHSVGTAGMRSKALVTIDPATGRMQGGTRLGTGLEHWMLKFQRDVNNAEPLEEYAFSQLARLAGLEVPETRLMPGSEGRRHFAIRRFDVCENQRRHVVTLSGLLDRPHRRLDLDYTEFYAAAVQLAGHHEAGLEVLRRCLFNVLIQNDDDHGRNHSFLLEGEQWRLAPAYDLTYLPGLDQGRAMRVSGQRGRVGRKDVDRLARDCGVAKNVLRNLEEQVMGALDRWPEIAAGAGVPEGEIDTIQSVLRSGREAMSR
jgi:serine/threonine-protein kinase HipA